MATANDIELTEEQQKTLLDAIGVSTAPADAQPDATVKSVGGGPSLQEAITEALGMGEAFSLIIKPHSPDQ